MAFAHVQSKKTYLSPPYTQLDIPYASNVASGHLLVCVVSLQPYTATSVVTDSQGNTWAAANSRLGDSDTNYSMQIFYAVAGSSAANTVTITPTGASVFIGTIYEFSGNLATPLDGTGGGSTGGGTNPSCTITTSQSNDLIVAAAVSKGGSLTVGASYTAGPALNPVWYELNEYLLDASAAGLKTVPVVGGAGNGIVSAAAFKIAAGGGTTKTVTTTLVASPTDSTPVASLTGIKWVFFDQVAGATFNAPIDQGTTATTNGSGVCVITLTNSVKTNGQVGTLGLMYSDGTVAYANRGMLVPVTVVVS